MTEDQATVRLPVPGPPQWIGRKSHPALNPRGHDGPFGLAIRPQGPAVPDAATGYLGRREDGVEVFGDRQEEPPHGLPPARLGCQRLVVNINAHVPDRTWMLPGWPCPHRARDARRRRFEEQHR